MDIQIIKCEDQKNRFKLEFMGGMQHMLTLQNALEQYVSNYGQDSNSTEFSHAVATDMLDLVNKELLNHL